MKYLQNPPTSSSKRSNYHLKEVLLVCKWTFLFELGIIAFENQFCMYTILYKEQFCIMYKQSTRIPQLKKLTLMIIQNLKG